MTYLFIELTYTMNFYLLENKIKMSIRQVFTKWNNVTDVCSRVVYTLHEMLTFDIAVRRVDGLVECRSVNTNCDAAVDALCNNH